MTRASIEIYTKGGNASATRAIIAKHCPMQENVALGTWKEKVR